LKKTKKAKLLFTADEFLTKFRSAYCSDLGEVSNPSPFHHYARDRWLQDFDKKFLLPGDKDSRKRLSFEKFLSVNGEMSSVNETFDPSLDIEILPFLLCAKATIRTVLGPLPSLEEIFIGCKNSSGTSIGVPFWDTSPERKFRYPISMTDSVVPMWEAYLKWDHDLDLAIKCLNEESKETSASVTVSGSRACTVPKTNDIDRMIAVEPVVNMFFQHGISTVMEDKLKKVGLSFKSDQERHRKMAYEGSISNRLSTIDFSSMSDRISLKVCQFLLPKDWYSLLCLVRSPVMTLSGLPVNLSMISTMGNATTFPLETLLLWSLVMASTQSLFENHKTLPNWSVFRKKVQPVTSVFGDDCILPSRVAPLFIRICSSLGFKTNESKSFFRDEHFRESCGGDFYHGRDVRPLYLEALPEKSQPIMIEAYLYKTLNGVLRQYIKYHGTLRYLYDSKLISYLLELLCSVTDQVKFVPEYFPEDSGICFIHEKARFLIHYKFIGRFLSPIYLDENYMLSFRYLRFSYSEPSLWDNRLRYAIALKRLFASRDVVVSPLKTDFLQEIRQEAKLRKRGKYLCSVSKCDNSLTLPSTLIKRTEAWVFPYPSTALNRVST
jgi:hypothetical protein